MTLTGGIAEFILTDDGAGIDLAKVRKAAVDSGSLLPVEVDKLDEASIISRIFLPGVSTSPIVTGISGRGMGLAIVREVVARLPQTAVMKTQGGESIALDDSVYSLVHLGDALGLPRGINPDTPQKFPIVVLESSGKRVALVVDRIMEEQEVLVKPLGKLLPRVRGILGVSVLGTGEILPVLYPKDIVLGNVASRPSAGRTESDSDQSKKSILVVEDSITSRMLLKSIFESAGYEVTVANDGIEGITALKTGDFNLVVSDVEMPRMDGFGLTAAIRADKSLERLPVILVTSLESREHKEKGVAAGANAYISKSNFAQSNLLETVARFL